MLGDQLEHGRASRAAASPSSSTTGTGSISMPALAQLELEPSPTRAPSRRAPPRARAASFTESTVGSQTVRAPSRAAISTASGFIPPTARLSVIAPERLAPRAPRRAPRSRARRSTCSATSARTPASPSSAKRRRERDVVDLALHHVGGDVDVGVVGARAAARVPAAREPLPVRSRVLPTAGGGAQRVGHVGQVPAHRRLGGVGIPRRHRVDDRRVLGERALRCGREAGSSGTGSAPAAT